MKKNKYLNITATTIMTACFTSFLINCTADELNLLVNPSFQRGLTDWTHADAGSFNKAVGKGIKGSDCVEITGGSLWQMIIHSPKSPKYRYKVDEIIGPADRLYRFSIMAKGSETIEAGVKSLISTPDNKTETNNNWSHPVKLTGDWQKIEFSGQEKNPRCFALQPTIRLSGNSNSPVLLDDADFKYYAAQDTQLKVNPAYIAGFPGAKLKTDISVLKDNQPCRDIPVNIRTFYSPQGFGFDGEMQETKGKTGPEGIVAYALDVPLKNASEVLRASISVPKFSLAKNLFISLFKPDDVKNADNLASKIKLNSNLFILYIGDSNTEFRRGHNYTDMVDFFLNKHNPGLTSFENAGVGGDYITRVWERVEGTKGGKPAYRQDAYNNLLSQKPDLIFIALGGNDSRALSTHNYKIPLVQPEKQYELYNKLVDYLRENTKAKIVFVSTPSFYLPVQEKNAEKSRAQNKTHVLFGLDEHIVNFNNTLKKICAEKNIDYIDVYTPTKNHPEKQKLFSANDGVHFSEEGNLVVANAIIEYLITKHPKK
ncbi:MAG: GDSL-type esterase/lipase family protein [Kiritimatiellia bacterium]|nr:GDSL-type esterase/lipase family protein [Kiritimatiellia bacterium]